MTDDLKIIKDAFDEEIKKHKLYKHAKHKMPQPKERSSKVKHLNDEQIRQEKGLRAKPFTTQTENILWTVIYKGPISTRGIKLFLDEELKANYSAMSISAVITRLKHVHGIICERETPFSKAYLYSSTENDINKLKTGIYRDAYIERSRAVERKLGRAVAADIAASWKDAHAKRAEMIEQKLRAPCDIRAIVAGQADEVTITPPPTQVDAAETFSALVQKLFKGLSLEITIKLK